MIPATGLNCMTLMNKNNLSQDPRELSMQVSLYGLSFMIKNPKTKENKFFEYSFDKTNPLQVQDKLQQIVKERPVLKHHFSKIRIIHHNLLNTLVPSKYFEDSKLEEYLKFNISLLENDKASYDEIRNIDIVNVYLPFVNINNFFLNYNPSINYFHSASVFLDKINQLRNKKDTWPLYDLYLNVYSKDFQLLIYKNEELYFFNSFEYETPDDFLYFFFFVLESLKLNEEEIDYHLCGVNKSFPLYKDLTDFVPHWKILPASNPGKINNFIL
jgi:hypothetical protein